MARKQWHAYLMKGARGMLTAGVTNEIEKVDALYAEACRDRTEALKKEAAVRTMTRAQKLQLIKVSKAFPNNELPGKLYRVINEGFTCANCGARVLPTEHDMPRNHCPFCLHSLHVDVQPGDRKNRCHGLLMPVEVDTSGRKGYVIVYECEKCGERTRAKAAFKSTVQPDDFDMLVELSRHALKKSDLLF